MSEADSTEVFRIVPGWPMFRVSDLGRVQRKHTPGRRTFDPSDYEWVDVTQRFDRRGLYLVVHLNVGKTTKVRTVHSLVLEAFVGPRPMGMVGRHVLDNDKTDNRLVNLAWGTHAQNMGDKKQHGTNPQGERNPLAKLTDRDVEGMRRLRACGVSRRVIAKIFRVSPTHVSKVMLGDLWQHMAPTPEERAKLRSKGYVRGEKHHFSKLSNEQITQIKQLAKEGHTGTAIAKMFGVCKSTTCRIIRETIRSEQA